jgi:hypothetical protein
VSYENKTLRARILLLTHSKYGFRTKKKRLFIISPIGKEGSETRNFFDKVKRHIIYKAAEGKGYSPYRGDEIREPGKITSQIIRRLRDDDLVIADISTSNPNVFYELAIRHAVQKPVILIGQNTDNIPFDIANQELLNTAWIQTILLHQ